MKKSFLAKTSAALGVAFTLMNANSIAYAEDAKDNKNILYVYNWTEYIPTSVLNAFTKETGIEVRYSTYESNEEMYSKLKLLDGENYDIVVPSSYYVQLMVKDGLIQKLDPSKVDFAGIIDGLKNKDFDPKNEYSVPYVYGFTALGVNSSVYKTAELTSWRDLWKPQYQQLALLNDVVDVFSMALLSRGVNPNQATPEQIKQAYEDLTKLTPKVVQYNSDSPEVPYVEGSANVGMIWSGSAFRGQGETGGELQMVYPKEGAILWIDNFAISSKAKNVEGAYKFINFILRPDIGLQITQEMGFQVSSSKVKALMPEAWQKNPILFPSDEIYNKAIINNVSEEQRALFSKYWQLLKVD